MRNNLYKEQAHTNDKPKIKKDAKRWDALMAETMYGAMGRWIAGLLLILLLTVIILSK